MPSAHVRPALAAPVQLARMRTLPQGLLPVCGFQHTEPGARHRCLRRPRALSQARHAASAGGVASNIDTETHKTGMEPGSERQRDLTPVAQVRVATGWTPQLACWQAAVLVVWGGCWSCA